MTAAKTVAGPGSPSSPHLEPVEVLVFRAAAALYADAVSHVAGAPSFGFADPDFTAPFVRRARLALVAAFPALGEAVRSS